MREESLMKRNNKWPSALLCAMVLCAGNMASAFAQGNAANADSS